MRSRGSSGSPGLNEHIIEWLHYEHINSADKGEKKNGRINIKDMIKK